MSDETLIEAALARNDEYLQQFVEARNICPFARRCRESGALERRVLLQRVPDREAVLEVIAELSRPGFAHVEVALLILPRLEIDAAAFEAFTTSVRQAMAKPQVLHLVAFHPDAPFDGVNAHRMVPLFRRSPDPTMQLVRASLLDSMKGAGDDTVWRDPKTIDLEQLLLDPPARSVSEAITLANQRSAQEAGVDVIEAQLGELRRKGR